jgi:hypothetical protein
MASIPKPASDWQDLLTLAQGSTLIIERVRLKEKHLSIEGEFALPDLARVSLEDQVFIAAFLRAHGSIKEMEQVFGVSYPTIKARLNRLASQFNFVESNPAPSKAEILARLQAGEITADEAVRALEALR